MVEAFQQTPEPNLKSQDIQPTSPKVTSASFNQDSSCLIVGTAESGFYIYQTSPLRRVYQSRKHNSTERHPCVLYAEMQFTSNLLIMVQQSHKHKMTQEEKAMKGYNRSSLVVYDTTEDTALYLIQVFQKIVGIKINMNFIVVLSKDKIFVYDVHELQLLVKLPISQHFGRVFLHENLIIYSSISQIGKLTLYDIEDSQKEEHDFFAHAPILHIQCTQSGSLCLCSTSGQIKVIENLIVVADFQVDESKYGIVTQLMFENGVVVALTDKSQIVAFSFAKETENYSFCSLFKSSSRAKMILTHQLDTEKKNYKCGVFINQILCLETTEKQLTIIRFDNIEGKKEYSVQSLNL